MSVARSSPIKARLRDHGYTPHRATTEEAASREVTDYLAFEDPDGNGVEVYYGARRDQTPFISPTGARFVTKNMGIGHVMFAVSSSAPFRELYLDIFELGLATSSTSVPTREPSCTATRATTPSPSPTGPASLLAWAT
ncbi:hypothetical protein SHIRM173S_00271 [Streptomyces hirsutus]